MLPEARIFMSDFGESFMPSTTARHYSNTPVLSAPPEVRFAPQTPLLFLADIWSLACTAWSIFDAKPPFEGFAPTDDWMTREHVTVLGKLPPQWWEKDARLQWFNEDGTRNYDRLGTPWAERFESFVQKARSRNGMELVGQEERSALLAILRAMLAFRPEKRLTAEEALNSRWMKECAVPEFERMKKMESED